MGRSPLATGQRGNIVLGCLDESLVDRNTITLFGFLFVFLFLQQGQQSVMSQM